MPVRVYFPESTSPKEYASAVIATGRTSTELQDGSLVIRDYGIHIQKGNEETIWPWSVAQQIKLQSKGQ